MCSGYCQTLGTGSPGEEENESLPGRSDCWQGVNFKAVCKQRGWRQPWQIHGDKETDTGLLEADGAGIFEARVGHE